MTFPAATATAATLLVVDDDPNLARALQILLEDERPYPVLTATTAAEALACLARHPEVAAVLCDATLATDAGLPLVALISGCHPQLAVVATGVQRPRAAATPRDGELRAPPSVRKPVDPAELLALVDGLLAGA